MASSEDLYLSDADIGVDPISSADPGLGDDPDHGEEGDTEGEHADGNPEEGGARSERGAWDGSEVQQAEINWLYASRRIPPEVLCRLPGSEIVPDAHPGEYVVFVEHFRRGFGLPLSDFAHSFFVRFGLQPHQLPANAYITLSCYITYTESYLGVLPSTNHFSKYFIIKPHSLPDKDNPVKTMTQCGGAMISPRRGSDFPRLDTLDSCKKWQKSFFYIRNKDPARDFIRLPNFLLGPPPAKPFWNYNPGEHLEDINKLHEALLRHKEEGLTAQDILITYVNRRLCPLQQRAHKMCYNSGYLDPTRTSTFGLTKMQVWKRVKAISKIKLDQKWSFSLKPYNRTRPIPTVSYPYSGSYFLLPNFPLSFAEV